MHDYEELMSRLSEMRSRFDDGFSSSDRNFIERLYASMLNKKVRKSGCSDCFRDAYIELYHYLKKEGKMPNKPNYVLKAGVVIHPRGTNEFYANTNIPDEVAEAHLAKFPDAINDFLTFPADYKLRVASRKNGEVPVSTNNDELAEDYKAAVEKIKSLEAVLADARREEEETKKDLEKVTAQLEEAKAALENAGEGDGSDDDGTLSMENETLKADLASANEEIASLKAQLEEAKAASAPKKRGPKTTE